MQKTVSEVLKSGMLFILPFGRQANVLIATVHGYATDYWQDRYEITI